jgi:DNA-directed RNA polymerase subunit RPC12/RpoP
MENIVYGCVDCGREFGIELTDEETAGRLTQTHTEKCPGCGQFVGKGQMTCRSCRQRFEVDFPHWHVHCDWATGYCPKCGVEYRSLCIC